MFTREKKRSYEKIVDQEAMSIIFDLIQQDDHVSLSMNKHTQFIKNILLKEKLKTNKDTDPFDINKLDENYQGDSLLHYYCKKRDIDMVSFLLNQFEDTIDVNKMNDKCQTPLHLTIDYQKADGFIFEYEFDDDDIVKKVKERKYYKIAKMICQHNSFSFIKNEYCGEENILLSVCNEKKVAFFGLFDKYVSDFRSVYLTKKIKPPILFSIAMTGELGNVKYFCENFKDQINVNEMDERLYTAFCGACYSGYIPIAKYLCETFGDELIVTTVDNGNCAIYVKINENALSILLEECLDEDFIVYLLKKYKSQIDINYGYTSPRFLFKIPDGWCGCIKTIFYMGCYKGTIKIVQTMYEEYGDKLLSSFGERYCYFIAAFNNTNPNTTNRLKIFKYVCNIYKKIVNEHEDINIDDDDVTQNWFICFKPLINMNIYEEGGHYNILHMLCFRTNDEYEEDGLDETLSNDKIHDNDSVECFKYFYYTFYDIIDLEKQDYLGRDVFFNACRYNNYNLVLFLIQEQKQNKIKMFNFNQKDTSGENVIYHCSKHGYTNILKLILKEYPSCALLSEEEEEV